jgi:hypothetical protein
MSCQLYRHFNNKDELLYVGISLSAIARLSQHHDAEWFYQIARVEVQAFDDREAALRAEAFAINDEKPIFNKFRPRRPARTYDEIGQLIEDVRYEMWELLMDSTKQSVERDNIDDVLTMCSEIEKDMKLDAIKAWE